MFVKVAIKKSQMMIDKSKVLKPMKIKAKKKKILPAAFILITINSQHLNLYSKIKTSCLLTAPQKEKQGIMMMTKSNSSYNNIYFCPQLFQVTATKWKITFQQCHPRHIYHQLNMMEFLQRSDIVVSIKYMLHPWHPQVLVVVVAQPCQHQLNCPHVNFNH